MHKVLGSITCGVRKKPKRPLASFVKDHSLQAHRNRDFSSKEEKKKGIKKQLFPVFTFEIGSHVAQASLNLFCG